eukprot:CAMPEP_0197057306 /NCGR_PEP_ID=MMETSP1384-20130603/95575_1 /TAXON_ID=29189 /ORGANISM="Ammonia sp." /LENGTH=211 /DNA_ID=CAMNT_0042491681 /DNA_START=16 /DNA_END=651 /DNA_ORIENTATION=-
MAASNRPGFSRQTSLEYLGSGASSLQTSSLGSQLTCSACFLPQAIAAIVIAALYDASTSECANEEFVIDLPTFLYVAGFAQLADFMLHCCAMCGTSRVVSPDRTAALMRFTMAESCCFAIFHLIWAGIGWYIYIDEMSPECEHEAIGKMVLAWNIIIYVVFGSTVCCSCCFVPVMFHMMKPPGDTLEQYETEDVVDDADADADAEETDPLI